PRAKTFVVRNQNRETDNRGHSIADFARRSPPHGRQQSRRPELQESWSNYALPWPLHKSDMMSPPWVASPSRLVFSNKTFLINHLPACPKPRPPAPHPSKSDTFRHSFDTHVELCRVDSSSRSANSPCIRSCQRVVSYRWEKGCVQIGFVSQNWFFGHRERAISRLTGGRAGPSGS